jgi:hypothetical protein
MAGSICRPAIKNDSGAICEAWRAVEFMAETSLNPLKAILETIRERADFALKQLQKSEEERSMWWKCKAFWMFMLKSI